MCHACSLWFTTGSWCHWRTQKVFEFNLLPWHMKAASCSLSEFQYKMYKHRKRLLTDRNKHSRYEWVNGVRFRVSFSWYIKPRYDFSFFSLSPSFFDWFSFILFLLLLKGEKLSSSKKRTILKQQDGWWIDRNMTVLKMKVIDIIR